MRKVILLILLCFLFFSMPVESKSKDLRFIIVFDSNENELIERKKEIVDLVNDMLDHVGENSFYELLENAVDELTTEDREVYFYKSTLFFYLGDTKGIKIEGSFVKNSFCMAEVKPKSFIRQWFNF